MCKFQFVGLFKVRLIGKMHRAERAVIVKAGEAVSALTIAGCPAISP